MKTIDTYMKQVIQNGKGNVLAIGPTEKMLTFLNENNAITVCDILSRENKNNGKKTIFPKRQKTFNFKKMRKTFQKKKKDMVIGDILEIEHHMKTFIKDSIYITNGNIYLFVKDANYDFDLLMRRYKRFKITCTLVHVQDGSILEITVGNARNQYWKEKLYYIVDTLINIVDVIGDILSS